MDSIVNRVAKSSLITIDLEQNYPTEEIVGLDISQWLDQGLLLREKPFRESLKNYDWTSFTNKRVYLYCSNDAILPGWAYLLITTYLSSVAKQVSIGSKENLINEYYLYYIDNMDVKDYDNKKVIVKGCSNREIPDNAYIQLINKIKPVVQSLMFGEPCSTVPLYKHNS